MVKLDRKTLIEKTKEIKKKGGISPKRAKMSPEMRERSRAKLEKLKKLLS